MNNTCFLDLCDLFVAYLHTHLSSGGCFSEIFKCICAHSLWRLNSLLAVDLSHLQWLGPSLFRFMPQLLQHILCFCTFLGSFWVCNELCIDGSIWPLSLLHFYKHICSAISWACITSWFCVELSPLASIPMQIDLIIFYYSSSRSMQTNFASYRHQVSTLRDLGSSF